MPCDIRNHISKAKKALELSKVDQENLKLKIEEWKRSSPTSNHFFRPYIKKSDIENEYQSAGKEAQNDGINLNNEEENDCVQGFTDECSQTFLWIHQEKWQKDLLVKFGNTITLIDATYKTTKYEVALFFLCVKTNVGYVVVAGFIRISS